MKLNEPHGDNHDLWIASNDGKRMIQSSNGGASVSYTRGETWTDQDYSTAQFYHVETTNHFPYRVCGAQQDDSGRVRSESVLPVAFRAASGTT